MDAEAHQATVDRAAVGVPPVAPRPLRSPAPAAHRRFRSLVRKADRNAEPRASKMLGRELRANPSQIWTARLLRTATGS
jgi:hypothetical protein